MSVWPGYTGQCNPEVWSKASMPEQPKQRKPGQLSTEQLNEYYENGVVLLQNYLSADELDPIKAEIEILVDDLANWLLEGGKITSLYKEHGFYQRLTMLSKEYPGAHLLLHKQGKMPQSMKNLFAGDKLCNAVEQLIGPDIGGHPVWNIRTKIPQDAATTVPWHQDCAYLDTRSYDVHQPTVWIPLLDANERNGCMEFALRAHKKGTIAMHQCCSGDTHYVMLEEEEMARSLNVDLDKDLKVIPMSYGSVVLFNNCVPHRSLSNLSNDVRWSLDLRWQNPNKQWGFHDIADGVWFRKSSDLNWRPGPEDWNKLLGSSKTYLSQADPYDPSIVGPWMKSWEVTNMNHLVEQA